MNKLSPDKYFKALSLLYVTLIFFQLLLILLVLFLRTEGYARPEFAEIELLKLIVPLFVGAGVYEGYVRFQKRLKKAREMSTLDRKLTVYRLALIMRYIYWGIPSLLAIGAFFITGEWIHLGLSGLMIIVFLTNRPSVDKAKKDLEL
jgi:uncharacterized membrane protein